MRCTVGVTSRSRRSAGSAARPSTSCVTAPVWASTLRIEPGSVGVMAVSTKRDPSAAQRTLTGTTGSRSTSTRWAPSASWIASVSAPSTWWQTKMADPSRETTARRSWPACSTNNRQSPSRPRCQIAWELAAVVGGQPPGRRRRRPSPRPRGWRARRGVGQRARFLRAGERDGRAVRNQAQRGDRDCETRHGTRMSPRRSRRRRRRPSRRPSRGRAPRCPCRRRCAGWWSRSRTWP